MLELSEVCRLLSVALLALLGAVCLRDHNRDPSALASVFLIVAVIDHLLVPILLAHAAPRMAVHAVVAAGLLVPFAFWVLAEAHFDDDFRLRPLHFGFVAALLAVGEVAWLTQRPAWALASKLLSLALVVHALVRVHVGGRSDLVVPRLKARYAVLVLSGSYIFFELLAEAFLVGSVSERMADRVHAATALALIFGVSFLSLRLQPEVLRPAPEAPEPPALDPALADRLRSLIEVEQVFREEGLTIAALAERLAVHEHKVRQLINAQLGFRNFNSFLHHFRVREAQKALADPGRAHQGVAQIAYEVGYRSLGPFNKAFKELTGQTPTEFRSARLA